MEVLVWCDEARDGMREIDEACYKNKHQKASHCPSSYPKPSYFHSCTSHFAPPTYPPPPSSLHPQLTQRPQHIDRSSNRALRAGPFISHQFHFPFPSMGFETPFSQAEDDIALHNSRQVAYEETGSFKALDFVTDAGGKYTYVCIDE